MSGAWRFQPEKHSRQPRAHGVAGLRSCLVWRSGVRSRVFDEPLFSQGPVANTPSCWHEIDDRNILVRVSIGAARAGYGTTRMPAVADADAGACRWQITGRVFGFRPAAIRPRVCLGGTGKFFAAQDHGFMV